MSRDLPPLPVVMRQRGLVALIQVLALATWFSASAVVPTLRQEWSLSAGAAVWLTATTQVGFVAGAVVSAATNLADRVSPPRLLGVAATGAAACTALIGAVATGPGLALPLRFATGVFLAGVYPVGMKVMASWASPATRALSFGLLIGALTLGSNLPHLIRGLDLPWRGVLLVAAAAALAGALLSATLLQVGPHLERRPIRLDPRYVLRMFADRRQRLVNLGYFGHMWELYALWTWFPSFVLAGRTAAGTGEGSAGTVGVFLTMGVAGAIGCLVGGWSAVRRGRSITALVALVLSGACCVVSPAVFAAPTGVLLIFAAVWGAAVIADSGVFSTMLSVLVDDAYAGTALTAQTAIGFLLTVVTIQTVPLLAAVVGWQYALVLLALGPVAGVLALAAFRRADVAADQSS